MASDRMKKFLGSNGKSILLAYDQGLEHGPSADFNEKNVDPQYIVDIGLKGSFSGLVFQKGVAEKYYQGGKLPLIIKINGKSNLPKGEPISRRVCTVEEAISLGASGVGYTIYAGSEHESIMLAEFGSIVREAHKHEIPAIAWIYPRGVAIKNDIAPEIISYAARIGLEVGADAVKIKYTGDPKTFSWAVKAAGKAHVFMSGGPKTPTDDDFLRQISGIMEAGATGLAVGRNVWQHPDPLKLTEQLKQIIFGGKRLVQVPASK